MQPVNVTIGNVHLTVPPQAAARGLIEMCLPDTPDAAAIGGMVVALPVNTALPAIGADWNGGKYAGLSIEDNRPVALVLLAGDEGDLTWDKAVAWAEKQGGVLPSRIDQIVLFRNLKSEFKAECYWSGEQRASGSACAWGQDFSFGGQGYWRKDDETRARAVRRYPI